MLKPLAIVLSAALIGASASREPEPIAPAAPLELRTTIGQLGTPRRPALTVSLVATITPKRCDLDVKLYDHNFMGITGRVDHSAACELADAIDAAAAEAGAGRTHTSSVGAIKITTATSSSGSMVTVELPPNDDPPSERCVVTFDADNAPVVAQLLRRAASTAAWLRPRLKHFDLSGR